MTQEDELDAIEQEFRKQFDELGLKPPKNSMPNLERELIIDYWRKACKQLIEAEVLRGKLEAVKEMYRRCWTWVPETARDDHRNTSEVGQRMLKYLRELEQADLEHKIKASKGDWFKGDGEYKFVKTSVTSEKQQ
jgi:hypothetical protein